MRTVIIGRVRNRVRTFATALVGGAGPVAANGDIDDH